MTSAITLVLILLLTPAARISAETPLKWITFDRLCGSLEFFTPDPGGGGDSKPLKNVLLKLYRWDEGVLCCSKTHLALRTVTGRGGRYEFKGATPGRYWLVANWKGEILQLPIIFTAKGQADEDCEWQGLNIDNSGNFVSWIRATM